MRIKHDQAFSIYLDMPDDAILTDLGDKLHGAGYKFAQSTINTWSTRHNWVERRKIALKDRDPNSVAGKIETVMKLAKKVPDALALADAMVKLAMIDLIKAQQNQNTIRASELNAKAKTWILMIEARDLTFASQEARRQAGGNLAGGNLAGGNPDRMKDKAPQLASVPASGRRTERAVVTLGEFYDKIIPGGNASPGKS